jgi:excisionase family DNA binding protein
VIDGSDLVRVEEVAETLGVSTRTVKRWVQAGDIPRNTYLKAGTTYRFDLKAVIAALRASNTDDSAESTGEQND